MEGQIPDINKWIVLYPVYINSKKTIAEGRRICAAKACENPTCAEIGDCCSHLKLLYDIEVEKAYPRDFMQRGRVRVLLKREDGTLYNPAISSRTYSSNLIVNPSVSQPVLETIDEEPFLRLVKSSSSAWKRYNSLNLHTVTELCITSACEFLLLWT